MIRPCVLLTTVCRALATPGWSAPLWAPATSAAPVPRATLLVTGSTANL